MNFNEYQKQSRATALYPNTGDNLPYLALGITDEAGEVAGKVKKFIRDHNMHSIADLSDEQKQDLAKELGDVLWYVAQIATETGYELETIARMNGEKLASRLERDKLSGSGDDR